MNLFHSNNIGTYLLRDLDKILETHFQGYFRLLPNDLRVGHKIAERIK